MRLDFNVLWIDDQPAAVESQKIPISLYMKDHGFNFNATHCASVDEVGAHLTDDLFKDEIDLILVDWDLGAGKRGQDVIAAIRDRVRYRDVVFYSAQATTEELRLESFKAKLEGVYCAPRVDLVLEVQEVFDALVKKVLDLDHTRGIVMGATSDIDHLVAESLRHLHQAASEEEKAAIIKKAIKVMKESLVSHNKTLEKLNDETTMEALFAAHTLFNAQHKLRVLKDALSRAQIEEVEKFRASVKVYMDDVSSVRNRLGHVLLSPEGKPESVAVIEGEPVSLEDMRDLRRLILTLRGDFRELLRGVTPVENSVPSIEV